MHRSAFLKERSEKHSHQSAEKKDNCSQGHEYVQKAWSQSEAVNDTKNGDKNRTGQKECGSLAHPFSSR
jgi:hypothetical protein